MTSNSSNSSNSSYKPIKYELIETNEFFILSLDGGGCRGVIVLEFLYAMENYIVDNIDPTFNLRDRVDLFTGTSGGSLFCNFFATACLSLSQIYDIFTNEVIQNILPQSKIPIYQDIKEMIIPKYDGKYKANIQQQYLGDKTLCSSDKLLLIPAYNLYTNRTIFLLILYNKIIKLISVMLL